MEINEMENNVESQLQDLFSDEEPFQDSGSEYLPDSLSSDEVERILEDSGERQPEEDNIVQEKSRKRIRKEHLWVRNIRKHKKSKGDEYTNSKGNIVAAKNFSPVTCVCRNKCHEKIDIERQKKLFDEYYKIPTYDLQTAFLFSLIKVQEVARKVTQSVTSRRENTRHYFLSNGIGADIFVCKPFFKKIFQVSDGRLTRLLKNKVSNPIAPTDQRGKSSSANKTSEAKVNLVIDFIKKIPKYDSHYTLNKSTRKYLAPDLNLSKLYELYCMEHAENERVSYFMFRNFFNEKFNLSFHAPITDSCRKCDLLDNKIKSTFGDEKRENETQKKLHVLKADTARKNFKLDIEKGKESGNVSVICFDLMSTLPTPVLSTGITYYKRQLWTYCFGIHDLITNDVYIYMWNESVASRGPQEIGSCLLHFIKTFVPNKKLVMYSDQCGGQNRNVKIAVLCQYIINSPQFTVEEINHKFFVSGHSYLPCDQDFGLITRQKKYFPNIFEPAHWKQVVLAARRRHPFKVIEMTSQDFYSTKRLEQNIINRKIAKDGSKIEWLKIQWLMYHVRHPYSVYFKYSNNDEVLFVEGDFKKRTSLQSPAECVLETLYPDGRAITKEKKKDLLTLIDFIPPVHHTFYINLKESSRAEPDLIEVNTED